MPSALGSRARSDRARYSLFSRQLDIFSAALGLGANLLRDRLFPTRNASYHRRRARKLVDRIVYLGPTFIKIGQSLSTRVDFFSPIYTDALSQLHDRVPAFSLAAAVATIEAELQAPIASTFARFDPIPIAAASLGQVHRAQLLTGEEVVVKVQRPDLQELFEIDDRVMRQLHWWLQFILPKHRSRELRAIHDEFFSLLFQEIDYTHEARNADRFRANFQQDPTVVVATVYWKYTTPRVLTMKYLPGVKIDDRASLIACGFDPKQILQLGICCYLKQLLVDGFFQADPHPGNMAITAEGKLAVYDFGMMVELKQISTATTIATFWAVVRKDAAAVTERLLELGLVDPAADIRPVRRTIEFLVERFTERPVDLQELEQIKTEVRALFVKQPFKISPEMSLILKALSTLDGIARTLDSNYSLLGAAQPFIRKMTLGKRGNAVVQFGQQAVNYLQHQFSSDRSAAASALVSSQHAPKTNRKLIYAGIGLGATLTALASTHPMLLQSIVDFAAQISRIN